MNKIILLAEDSEDDALAFRRTLSNCRILNPVVEVRSGKEAIAYLRGDGAYADREEFPYPVVLCLDLLMADGDGWDVLDWLRANPGKKTMLVIILTGPAQRELLHRAYMSGANSFLLKPFTKGELDTLTEAWPNLWQYGSEDPRAQPVTGNEKQPEPRL